MLKKAENFKLDSPAEKSGDTIDLGGGVKAVLNVTGGIDNPISDIRATFINFAITDHNGNVFYRIPCKDFLQKLIYSREKEAKKFEKKLRDESIKRQETAIKSLLEKLPQIIRDKMSENSEQNSFFQTVLYS